MQIKTPIRMAKIQNMTPPNVGEDVEQQELSHSLLAEIKII